MRRHLARRLAWLPLLILLAAAFWTAAPARATAGGGHLLTGGATLAGGDFLAIRAVGRRVNTPRGGVDAGGGTATFVPFDGAEITIAITCARFIVGSPPGHEVRAEGIGSNGATYLIMVLDNVFGDGKDYAEVEQAPLEFCNILFPSLSPEITSGGFTVTHLPQVGP